MGYTTESVPFFDGDIRIRVTESDDAGLVGKTLRIHDYAPGTPVKLLRHVESGEWLVIMSDFLGRDSHRFIQGPQA